MWRDMGGIVLTVILGYGSNAMSQTACLENAAFWYSHVMMSGQPYYVKLEPGQEHIPDVLDHVGAPYTLVTTATEKTAFPQVRIRTNAWVPCVTSERFDAAADATKRASFTAHDLAMFGMPLFMGNSLDIPTLSP
ncbi:MAG: hypothetical protein WD425_04395 [Nitrospirales bacterium]